MRAILFAPAAVLLLSACGASSDPTAVIETVRMTEQAQAEAIAAGDLDGALRVYAHDAVVTGRTGTPAKGADAIRTAYRTLLDDPHHAVQVTPGAAWAAESGEMAVTTSATRLTRTDPDSGQPVTVPINTQTVWRKAAQGLPWQIVAEQHVELPAAPAA